MAFFCIRPASDADLFHGTSGGCTELYEVTDCEGNRAYELWFSTAFQDMLVRPHLAAETPA